MVMVGKFVPSVIVPVTPVRSIVPPPPAFASRMAWRKEPGPESVLLLTTNVAACRPEAHNVTAVRTARVVPKVRFMICTLLPFIQLISWFQ